MRAALVVGLGVALGLALPAAAFTPTDPLAPRQWYLAANRTYDAWPEPPALAPVRIAIIDSGIDGGHPELTRHVVDARSFVGGSPRVDTQGHGTFVAGLIAADVNDGVGIAGSFPSAELLIAKVVTQGGTIPVRAEADAIRWAVDQHARVINMSLGGVRDPLHPARDTYSRLEADAIAYAVAHDVVIVAAVGNGDQAPSEPWRFASYPAALPHVLGVSAYAQDGSSPSFSNRDAVFDDVAAPGEGILSTFPRALTAERPACLEQGYSSCGPDEYRSGEGTSFAAPQVTAAAAMLLAIQPSLTSDQVTTILERTADDANASNGCGLCPLGRDAFTGWGRLDVAAAVASLSGFPPPADSLEPNDGVGVQAATVWGASRSIVATLDYWDDPVDVYRLRLRRGQKVYAVLSGPKGTSATLALWRPGTTRVDVPRPGAEPVRRSARHGSVERLAFTAPTGGFYDLEARLTVPGTGAYRLQLAKS